MYGYIERVKFISITVSGHTFTQVVKNKTVQIVVSSDSISQDVLNRANEFIRLKFGEEYIDKKIIKISVGAKCFIYLGSTIDCSVPFRNVKK